MKIAERAKEILACMGYGRHPACIKLTEREEAICRAVEEAIAAAMLHHRATPDTPQFRPLTPADYASEFRPAE